jgi:hypothetical protein
MLATHQREVCGEVVLKGARDAKTHRTWRSLHSPSLWPSRLKGWFTPGI